MLADQDMMAVLYARNRVEAERYLALLEEVRIPATIEHAPDVDRTCAVVLVPEDKHERASEIIASLKASEDGDWEDDEGDEFLDDDDDDDDLADTDDEFDDTEDIPDGDT